MNTLRYDSIHIIYNPNSTGPSVRYAKEFANEIKDRYPALKVTLYETEYAGHAEEIAYDCATASGRPLIISSSGDGGYSEVINGVMQARTAGTKPACAVLAAGNANDHSRTLQDSSLLEAVINEQETFIDLLQVQYKKNGETIERYAHSYIGLGLTPVVAVELNKTSLNALKELLIVLKTFFSFRPFKITVKGKTLQLDSIIFTNIGEMAKVLTISKNAKPDDGLFEVVTFPHAHKIKLLRRLLKASVTGLSQSRNYESYTFAVLKRMPAQLDGEVTFIDKGSDVQVAAVKQCLRTIL